MLLSSHECMAVRKDGPEAPVLRLFPAWPRNQSAAFWSLRAKGALLVTASWNSSRQMVDPPVAVASEQQQPVVMFNPWPGQPVCVQAQGQPVPVVRLSAQVVMFNTTACGPQLCHFSLSPCSATTS